MKRISYSLFLLCATALAGCTHEEAALENSNQNAPQGSQAATLTATIGINTRTYADNTTVKWSSGDSFYAFSADYYSYGTFELYDFRGDAHTSATFKCSSMVGEDVSELNYAVYPADGFTVTSDKITYKFPTEYAYPNSNAPMFGTISNGNVVFDQLLSGMVRVTLDTQSSGKLMLTGSGISGASTMISKATDGGLSNVLSSPSGQSTVTLSFTDATVLDVPVPAGDYSKNNIDVTLQIDNEVAVRTVGTIAEAISAGTIKNMESVQLSALTSATITVDDNTNLSADELKSYTDLTITGTLDASDVAAIKEWATLSESETAADKTLDLSDATITSNDLIFKDCTALTSVVLPEGTTSIADYAFIGCTNLTRVENTEQVETIGGYAFGFCTSLSDIDLSNVTTIGSEAFKNCTSLREVENATKVKTLGNYAFASCTSLTSIDLGNVETIGIKAFDGCRSLTSIEIPSSVTKIGDFAFAPCSGLEKVTCKADIATNPDNFASNAFDGIASDAVLYVPNKYLEAYTEKWGSSFTGGVKPITTENVDLTGEITGEYGK